MNAYVEHNFERGFIIDEANLRKLSDIVESRLKTLPSPLELTYKVYRGDSFTYETSSIDDVINEDNDDWRAITRLDLLCNEENKLDFRLSFSPKKTFLTITGDERDSIFLLLSDIKSYANNEIMTGQKHVNISRIVGVIIPSAFLVVFFGIMANEMKGNPAIINEVLNSENTNEKLNYMITDRHNGLMFMNLPYLMAGVLILTAVGATGILDRIWRYVFPRDLFLFGKRKIIFERKRNILSKIFWTVVIGAGVSLATGLILLKLNSA